MLRLGLGLWLLGGDKWFNLGPTVYTKRQKNQQRVCAAVIIKYKDGMNDHKIEKSFHSKYSFQLLLSFFILFFFVPILGLGACLFSLNVYRRTDCRHTLLYLVGLPILFLTEWQTMYKYIVYSTKWNWTRTITHFHFKVWSFFPFPYHYAMLNYT